MNNNLILTCPVCKNKLTQYENSFRCPKKHSFDVGKEKYVNLLLTSSQTSGDDKQMISARHAFLEKGYYCEIAKQLCILVEEHLPKTDDINIIDAGCGEGYYLNVLQGELKNKKIHYYGFDISKKAIQIAAKRNQQMTWFVGNAYHVPVSNASIDHFISMFSFYSVDEVKRVLKEDGLAIIFRAGRNHLLELKHILYNELSLKDSNHDFDETQFNIEKRNFQTNINVTSQEDLENLLLMTPHYWKTKQENKEQLKQYQSLTCTIDVDIYLIRLK